MRSSTLTHIAKWLLRLFFMPAAELKRMARHLDERLYTKTRVVVSGLFLLLAVAVVVANSVLDTWFNAGTGALLASALAVVTGLVWWWVNLQMVEVVGNAARYLDSAPANVGVRQTIRTECMRLLEDLNNSDDPGYSRIVVVGHSLGSVIAYDALRLMWAKLKSHCSSTADSLPKELARRRCPAVDHGCKHGEGVQVIHDHHHFRLGAKAIVSDRIFHRLLSVQNLRIDYVFSTLCDNACCWKIWSQSGNELSRNDGSRLRILFFHVNSISRSGNADC
jgi:hypothetical protein